MPECIARLIHRIEVRQELDDYGMGATPKEDYEIYRVDNDYVIPF